MKDLFLDKVIRKLRTKKVLKYISKKRGIVCDIGCGTEPKLLLGLDRVISEGWGIDKKARSQSWNDKIKVIKQDLDNESLLPFIKDKFDCVFMLAVFEHLKFPEKNLKDILRILKPGGTIVFTTPTPMAKPILEFLAFRLNLIGKEEIEDHKHYYSKKELVDILKDLGFCDIRHNYFEIGLNQRVIAKK